MEEGALIGPSRLSTCCTKQLKDLEHENALLKKRAVDQDFDKAILEETLKGKY